MPSAPAVIHLHSDDNIAVATRSLAAGTVVEVRGQPIPLREAIDLGHKVAVRAIAKGQPVKKFGQTIGFATTDVTAGQWVHTTTSRRERCRSTTRTRPKRRPHPPPSPG